MNDQPKWLKPLTPNVRTIKAMQAARRGELIEAGKPGRLLEK
jgi:hypothetical protein